MIWHILILILLVFLVYHKTLNFHYVGDDLTRYRQTDQPKKPKEWYRRLYQQLSFGKYYDDRDHKIGEEDPENMLAHLTSLVIHIVASVLIYLALGRNDLAFTAAIVFSILPFNHEVSMWMAANRYGITAIAALLCWWIPYLAPVMFYFSIWLGVTIIPFPVMFLTMPGVFKLLILLAPLALFIHYKCIFTDCGGTNSKMTAYCNYKEAFKVDWRKVIVWFKFYGYYFTCSLLGHKLAMFHKYNANYLCNRIDTDKAYKDLDVYFCLGVLLMCILIDLLIWDYDGMYGLAWGLLWFTICIAPFCNLINVGNMLVTSRYTYLANIGIAVMVANIIQQYPPALMILGWYFTRTLYVQKSYTNEFWNTEFQIIEEPKYVHSWILHGNMMWARGHFKAALQDYYEATIHQPQSFKAHFNISGVYVMFGDVAHAVEALEQAKRCELMGQEATKDEAVHEREVLIGDLFMAQKKGKRLEIDYGTLPMMV